MSISIGFFGVILVFGLIYATKSFWTPALESANSLARTAESKAKTLEAKERVRDSKSLNDLLQNVNLNEMKSADDVLKQLG